ncbi:MAG: SigE family RNA polymerase sigma factor [Acidimicrobiia bacterium]
MPEPPVLALAGTPKGRREAVVDLYQAHRAALVGLAALVAPSPGIAEDLVQEAFERLYLRWDRLHDPERALGYVRVAVVNLARGRGRREAVARRFRPERRRDEASAEDLAVGAERRRTVVAALRRLPTRQREVLALRHWCGMTETEIAGTLGISVGAVRTHASRGMAALDTHLGGTL